MNTKTIATHPTPGELAEQRHLVDTSDHALEHLADKFSAPLSPEREAEIRNHVATMSNFSLGNLFTCDLLAEVDRLRAELEKQTAVVAEFTAQRAEYITSILNCHPNNEHDYDRWQGHAAARRQLSERLGLPVAWPAEAEAAAVKDPTVIEYGIAIQDAGAEVVTNVTTDREQALRLQAHIRTGYPHARLVSRTAGHGDWTEVTA